MTALPLSVASAAALEEVSLATANSLLERWGHYLGACERPFGSSSHVLLVGGEPVSVAVAASTVSATAGGYSRQQLVELARLCSAPGASWATRVMLRLWREVCAPAWPHWPAAAAVAYSQSDRHEGRIYRFDGWQLVNENAGSLGGGTWSTGRDAGHAARGRKRLWLYDLRAAGVSSKGDES